VCGESYTSQILGGWRGWPRSFKREANLVLEDVKNRGLVSTESLRYGVLSLQNSWLRYTNLSADVASLLGTRRHKVCLISVASICKKSKSALPKQKRLGRRALLNFKMAQSVSLCCTTGSTHWSCLALGKHPLLIIVDMSLVFTSPKKSLGGGFKTTHSKLILPCLPCSTEKTGQFFLPLWYTTDDTTASVFRQAYT